MRASGCACEFVEQKLWRSHITQHMYIYSNAQRQACAIRLALADAYEREQRWTDAARILQDIPYDSGHKCVAFKLSGRLRVACVCSYARVHVCLYRSSARMRMFCVRVHVRSSICARASRADRCGDTGAPLDSDRTSLWTLWKGARACIRSGVWCVSVCLPSGIPVGLTLCLPPFSTFHLQPSGRFGAEACHRRAHRRQLHEGQPR